MQYAIMSLFVFITFYLNSNSSVTGKWQMGSPVADIRCRMWSADLQMSDDNLMTSPDNMMMTWYPGPGTADPQTDQIEIAIRCQLSLPGRKHNTFLRIEDWRFVYQIKKLVEPHSRTRAHNFLWGGVVIYGVVRLRPNTTRAGQGTGDGGRIPSGDWSPGGHSWDTSCALPLLLPTFNVFANEDQNLSCVPFLGDYCDIEIWIELFLIPSYGKLSTENLSGIDVICLENWRILY